MAPRKKRNTVKKAAVVDVNPAENLIADEVDIDQGAKKGSVAAKKVGGTDGNVNAGEKATTRRRKGNLGGPSKTTGRVEEAFEKPETEDEDGQVDTTEQAKVVAKKSKTASKTAPKIEEEKKIDEVEEKGVARKKRVVKRAASNMDDNNDDDFEMMQNGGKKKNAGSKKQADVDAHEHIESTTAKVNEEKRKVTRKKAAEIDEKQEEGNEEKQRGGTRKKRAVELKEAIQQQPSTNVTENKAAKTKQNPAGVLTKILTWNVAGVRAWIKKNGHEILTKENPDIVALQETKCTQIPEELQDGYFSYIDSAEKAGHGGVILLTKEKPIKVSFGFPAEDVVGVKGRLIVAEYDRYYLINGYVPNSGRGLVNLENRKVWEDAYLDFIKQLDEQKPVVYVGDLNVAHEEIDLANPKTNLNKTAGFTDQERNDFTRLLNAGFVDVYRKLNPEKEGAYTFWSNMRNAREKNIGWRLDYFVLSERLAGKVKGCNILADVKGSDHCPLTLDIEL